MRRMFLLVLAAVLAFAPAAYGAEKYGVYVKVVEQVQGSFDNAVKSTEEALSDAGWKVLASYESGVQERCAKRAHNIVAISGGYAEKIMQNGPHGAFAIPLRVGVYEDREGISIAFTNPASINRTVLGDEVAEGLSRSTMKELSGIIAGAVKGEVVNKQIGQIRSKGYVGGMGGGKFMKKIREIHSGEDLYDIVRGVRESIAANDKGWELVYSLEVPGADAVIFGLTKAKTEAKAFDIAGEKRERRSKNQYACPGIDHAAAFPIEVIAYREGGVVKVVTLKEMYRMKLYFQDAGNLAFMKNMTMPGRIEREVIEASTTKLKY